MLSYTVRYAVVLAVLAIGDATWLSYFARAVFRPTLGTILREHVRWPAAVGFYLLYALGIAFFAVGPALGNQSWKIALLHGVFFGFCAYMTYDLTNLATIDAWTVRLAAMDIAWGSLLSGIAGLCGYAAAHAFVPR